MNNSFISISTILNRLLRHPLLQHLTLDDAILYTEEFIRIVGSPLNYEDKVVTIEFNDNRCIAPEECINIIQIRDTVSKNIYKKATDTFFMSDKNIDLYYKQQGKFIYLSKEKGEIDLSYRTIPVDENGFPLLLDNSSFIKALELYIKKQSFTILFDLGKISHQVYNNTLQEYAFAVGQCQNNLVKPSLDDMQNITNILTSMIPKFREHKRGFKTLGIKDL